MEASNNSEKTVNLIPYKPGQSGNPKGRPKGSKGIAATLRKYLKAKVNFQNPITKKEGRMSAYDIMAIRLIVSAMSGNLKAIGQIYERLEGKPKQDIGVSGSLEMSEWAKLTPAQRMKKFEESTKD